MSRGYRVRWERAARTVKSKDELALQVQLLGILPEPEMLKLLREEVQAVGWTKRPSGALSKRVDGITVELDPSGKTVTARIEAEKTITARETTLAEAEQRVALLEKGEAHGMARELAQKLAKAEPEIVAELDAVVQRVYVAALKRKAASLGAVESITEGTCADGTREITIKVRT